MSLTLYLCRKNTFPGQMRCIFFSVSPRDREFPKTGHKMLAKWGIRLPNQFLSHNTLLQSKNQAKVAYFTKLMILIFGCPEEIRITNFTRMPLWLRKLLQSFSLLWFYLRVFYPWHKLCPGNCCLWAFLSMWWYQFTNVTDIGGAMYHENLQRNRWIFWYEDLTGVSILCVISTFHLTQTPLVFPLRLATDDSAALFKKK